MFLLCTGNKLFSQYDDITMPSGSDLKKALDKYSDHADFLDMIDLLNQLLQNDPDMRLSAAEALSHPWLASDEEE